MADDNWTKKALIDDSIVVALLCNLKHHRSSTSLPPLRWGHRQLRSKAPSKDHHRHPSTRCSPTTPLSWSAASVSDGCDTSAARSKGTFGHETGNATTCKKSRKKKTFTELKEEESYLMNERVHLEKELASVHVTLNEQRYRGNNLKRIKLKSQGPSKNEILTSRDERASTVFFQSHQTKTAADKQNYLILPGHSRNNDPESSSSCRLPKDTESRDRSFVLPDLNMTPSEEEPGCESLFQA